MLDHDLDAVEDVSDLGRYRDDPRRRADLVCSLCGARCGIVTDDRRVAWWEPAADLDADRGVRTYTVVAAAIDDLDAEGMYTFCAGRHCAERSAVLTFTRAVLAAAATGRRGHRVPAVLGTRARTPADHEDMMRSLDAEHRALVREVVHVRMASMAPAERARFAAALDAVVSDRIVEVLDRMKVRRHD